VEVILREAVGPRGDGPVAVGQGELDEIVILARPPHVAAPVLGNHPHSHILINPICQVPKGIPHRFDDQRVAFHSHDRGRAILQGGQDVQPSLGLDDQDLCFWKQVIGQRGGQVADEFPQLGLVPIGGRDG
jgi:hypothetical protein